MVLFYMVMGHEDREGFARAFMGHFLRGYRQEYELDPAWLREVPHFLKHREIDLYAIIHRSFDVENIDNRWVAMFMDNRQQRIENEVPFIDFDFRSLSSP